MDVEILKPQEVSFKPQDFLKNIADQPDYDAITKGIRSFKRKQKRIIPEQQKNCESCIYCQQSGSVYICQNPRVRKRIEPDYSCMRYIAARY